MPTTIATIILRRLLSGQLEHQESGSPKPDVPFQQIHFRCEVIVGGRRHHRSPGSRSAVPAGEKSRGRRRLHEQQTPVVRNRPDRIVSIPGRLPTRSVRPDHLPPDFNRALPRNLGTNLSSDPRKVTPGRSTGGYCPPARLQSRSSGSASTCNRSTQPRCCQFAEKDLHGGGPCIESKGWTRPRSLRFGKK
jgi:hypothetical protein